MKQMPQAERHFAEFNDIEQYTQAISTQGMRSFQLGTGSLNILLCELVFPDLIVRRIRTNRKIEEIYCLPAGWTTFSLTPGIETNNGVWCGVQSFPNAIAILRPDREHHCCIPGSWDALEIDVPDDLLIDEGIVPEQLLDRAMAPEKAILPLSVKTAYRLRHWLQSLLTDTSIIHRLRKDKIFASKLRQQILATLAATLAEGLHATDQRPLRHPYKHYPLLRQINNRIEQNSWQYMTINTLANDLEVSIRTLQRVFRKYYQISPNKYLLHRRLNAARSELQQPHINTSPIAVIAERYNFGSASQFAEHYKRIFDELPSVTLNRQSDKYQRHIPERH